MSTARTLQLVVLLNLTFLVYTITKRVATFTLVAVAVAVVTLMKPDNTISFFPADSVEISLWQL